MMAERFDIAVSMDGWGGVSVVKDLIAFISRSCRSGNIELGMYGKVGAVFETEIDDDGEDSGSNKADSTAVSFEVRLVF